jgi:hypothetical protein
MYIILQATRLKSYYTTGGVHLLGVEIRDPAQVRVAPGSANVTRRMLADPGRVACAVHAPSTRPLIVSSRTTIKTNNATCVCTYKITGPHSPFLISPRIRDNSTHCCGMLKRIRFRRVVSHAAKNTFLQLSLLTPTCVRSSPLLCAAYERHMANAFSDRGKRGHAAWKS